MIKIKAFQWLGQPEDQAIEIYISEDMIHLALDDQTHIGIDNIEKKLSTVFIGTMIYYVSTDQALKIIDKMDPPTSARGSDLSYEPEILNQTLIAESSDHNRSLETVDKALDVITKVMTAGRTVNGK